MTKQANDLYMVSFTPTEAMIVAAAGEQYSLEDKDLVTEEWQAMLKGSNAENHTKAHKGKGIYNLAQSHYKIDRATRKNHGGITNILAKCIDNNVWNRFFIDLFSGYRNTNWYKNLDLGGPFQTFILFSKKKILW